MAKRRSPGTPPPPCIEDDCTRPARKRRRCSTHYNKATGHYIGTVQKDPDRERARQRIRTHRRKDWSRLTDITPEYEMGLRAKAKRCPLCRVKLIDEPYLPNSKELDHIIPRGVGGTHTIGNVRITCRQCNGARPWDGSDYSGPVTLWAEVGLMPARRRLATVPTEAPRERAPDLRDAVRSTVDAMDWLTPTDEAMRTLALRQAEEIEKAVDRADELAAIARDAAGDPDVYKRLSALQSMCEVTKTVGWLGPQLQGVLRDLGGTPAARAAMKKDKPVGSRLAQLRDAATKHDD